MANVLVMTDTVACLPRDLADQSGIVIVPAAHITYDGNTYTEGVDISAKEAYDIIKKDPDSFATAAIAPGFLLEEFRKLATDHRSILFITISSALSAVAQSASVAAETLSQESPETRIRVVDSKTCAGAEGLIALAMTRAAVNGMDLDQLADLALEMRKKTGGVLMLDTLGYTYRTGRMTKSQALEAAKLKIKPINRMSDEGVMEYVDMVHKRSDGFKKMIEIVKNDATTDALHFMVSHADAPGAAQKLVDMLNKEFNCLSMVVSDYSPVMGYSTGPGAMFIGYHPELNL
ncbi:MAG: DegV family protein [Chloroflexota bacterium]|nr:DegV family protein [Chloroflexota bacterium]